MRTDWGRTLQAALEARERQYQSAAQRDASEQTESAAFALVGVLSHLEELPEFRSGRGLLPLRSLATSLLDLRDGAEPTLLRRPTVRHRPDTKERRDLKLVCAAGVAALVATDLKVTPACQVVAREMAKQGVCGRRGEGLCWNTVYDWHRSCQRDDVSSKKIRALVEDWQADPVEALTRDAVTQWIAKQAQKATLRSSSGISR